jgi:4-hydroxy-2-oxoheptanedioate aldolase
MRGIGKVTINENPVKYNLHHGLPAVGTWMTTCSPVSAEIMANIGWDWIVVDAEHSPVGFETMVNCFRAIQLGGAAPMARVPWNDTIWIQRTLDAGAMGLVVPMVNNVEDAKHAVSNMKYATVGQRSFGGSRVASYIKGDYYDWAQNNIAVVVMVETAEAVENVEEILSVEGVDGCFIGPNDLALSMGLTRDQTGPGSPHEAAIMRVLEAGKKVGKAAGKHCWDASEVNMRIEQGFQFLALNSDAAFMSKEAQAQFRQINLDDVPRGAGVGKPSLY